MPAYRPPVIAAREITPKNVYLSRRGFLGTAAGLAAIGLAGREAIAAPLSATAGAYKLEAGGAAQAQRDDGAEGLRRFCVQRGQGCRSDLAGVSAFSAVSGKGEGAQPSSVILAL